MCLRRTLAAACLRSGGKWTGATPLKFTYRWLRNGQAIAGATTDKHTIRSADLGHKLRCRVTATNVAGKATGQSAPVSILAAH